MGIQPGGDFPSTILSSIFSFFFILAITFNVCAKWNTLSVVHLEGRDN